MPLITIVGAGALGSHFVLGARNLGSLKVIDFDRIESKNILSQFHAKPSLGKLKTEALKSTLNMLFGVKLEIASVKLVDDNSKELLGKSDLVIDCLDNLESRLCVQRTVRALRIPCLHGGLSADGKFGCLSQGNRVLRGESRPPRWL